MKHPEVLLIPVLLFADYFLTVTGAVWKERKYDGHFRTPSYELNPMWQKHIAEKRWWNPRHILLTLLATAVFLWLGELGELPESFMQGLLGALVVFSGAVIGRHICNLLTFVHMSRRPDEISGQVTITQPFAIVLSVYQYFVLLVPLVFIVLFSPSPFAIGGLFGVALLLVAHLHWIRTYKRKAKMQANPEPGGTH